MVKTIKLKTRIGSDGVLNLRIPVDFTETDVEVVVTLQGNGSADSAWPPGYFERTYGSFKDEPLVRGDQGTLEVRDTLE